jgi:hypothetical protein
MLSQKGHLYLFQFAKWSGVVYILFLMIGMWFVAPYFPSQPATWSAEEVAAFYRDNLTEIRVGMVFVLVGSMFFVPWTAVIAQILARVEGKFGILAMSQVMAGCANLLLTAYPGGWWLIAAFRPERNPEITQMLHDTAWLQFLGVITPYYFVVISIIAAAFLDESEEPLIEKWVGYFNAWFLLTLIPLNIIFFFKSGPFALNGVFGFYLPFIIFWVWFVVMFFALSKAINRLYARGEL